MSLPSYKQASGLFLLALVSSALANARSPHPFPARFTVPKEKPAPIGLSTLLAGCTIGSVCPRCPSLKNRVFSLYYASKFSYLMVLDAAESASSCLIGLNKRYIVSGSKTHVASDLRCSSIHPAAEKELHRKRTFREEPFLDTRFPAYPILGNPGGMKGAGVYEPRLLNVIDPTRNRPY